MMKYIGKVIRYGREHGIKALVKKAVAVLISQNKNIVLVEDDSLLKINPKKIYKLSGIYDLWLKPMNALKVFYSPPGSKPRVNLYTDSIDGSSLFGGVITSIIFTFLWAKRNNAEVRIITRQRKAEEYRVKEILDHYEIDFRNEISFVFVHFLDNNKEIDVSDNDYFVTNYFLSIRTFCVL